MTDIEKYLFDLQGYLVLEGVVPATILQACNIALDRFEQMPVDEYPAPLCPGQDRTPENLYISNIIEGDDVFLDLMDLPTILDAVETITGGPYRLNHTYTIYRWGGGFTRLHMHGTPIIPKCQYHCRNGQMVSTLTKVVFPMLDSGPEDGCFAVIPGAHKSNFPKPWGNHPDENPPLAPVPARAGDAIIFTEALTHGSTVNASGRPRRTLYFCYSIGYMPDRGGQGLAFSDTFAGRLSDSRQALLRLK
ncbi:MAG: phytanoyl-CoA dioxygenase family protein [bacterium]|nr:phytanoyl-CoA dioxygenase family protein [bacterium]